MASRQPLSVEVLRGPVVESIHSVMVVVVGESGQVTHYWGNPSFVTMPRSAIKMLQALPLLESGAANHFGLDDKMIALACSSHRGEKEHLEVLSEWSDKVGFKENQLICGPHLPYNEQASQDMLIRQRKPTAFCNNCAGKHSGLITTCLHLHESIEGYGHYEHPAQKRLRSVLSETLQVDHFKMPHGIDGCGIPTYAVPLQSMAVGMSTFINSKIASSRKLAAERILSAVANNPFYLSGSDNFATEVIQKTKGRSIIKGGAEGVFCGVLPEKKIAFAVKAADGAGRAAQVATAAVLLNFGGMTAEEFTSLSKYTQPVITNWSGESVGQIRVAKVN